MKIAFRKRHQRTRPLCSKNTKKNGFQLLGLHVLAIGFLAAFSPNIASAQSASFAFGQGGFAETAYGSDGIFIECLGSIDGYGLSSCNAFTQITGNHGDTYVEQNTATGSPYVYQPNASVVGAQASLSQLGDGSTLTNCTLSQNSGMTNCASGAYASNLGAFAKTALMSRR